MPRLGAEQLSAFLLSLDTGAMRALGNARIKYTRILNAPSSAQVTLPATYTSQGRTIRPEVLPIVPWVDELVIYRTRNGRAPQRIWRGPITGWTENGGLLTLNAFDELARAQYMPVGKVDITGDVAMIAGRVLDRQIGHGAIDGVEIDYRPSGVSGTYRVTEGRKSFTFDALKQIDAKVDMTAVGDRIIVRGVDDHLMNSVFHEQNFAADIVTSQDFTAVPDQVVCYGAEQLVGAYPPDDALTFPGPVPLSKSIDRSEAKTLAECVQQARFEYEKLRLSEGLSIEVPNNATLNPDTEVDIDELVPGAIFHVVISERMQPITPRLFKVTAVSGQQGNASDNRPRMPAGGFDKTAETNKEYVGVTLEAYAPSVAPPVVIVQIPSGGTQYPPADVTQPGRGPAPQTVGGAPGARQPAPPAGGIDGGGRLPAPSAPGDSSGTGVLIGDDPAERAPAPSAGGTTTPRGAAPQA